jgi:hypothetical protein
MRTETCSGVWRDIKALRWTASCRLFLTRLGIYYARWDLQRKEVTQFMAFLRFYADVRNPSKPRMLKVLGPKWEHSGWIRNTRKLRLLRCYGEACKSVRVLRSFFRQRFGWSSIVTESRFGLFGTHIGILQRMVHRRRKLPRPNFQIRWLVDRQFCCRFAVLSWIWYCGS